MNFTDMDMGYIILLILIPAALIFTLVVHLWFNKIDGGRSAGGRLGGSWNKNKSIVLMIGYFILSIITFIIAFVFKDKENKNEEK